MGVIVVLALINYFGVKVGGNVQVVVTLVKVGLIAAIIVIGLGTGSWNVANYHYLHPSAWWYYWVFRGAGGGVMGVRRLEQRQRWWRRRSANPQRNLPLALIVGHARR